MNLEDLKIVMFPQNDEIKFIEWAEGLTKTRHGGLVKPYRRVPQRLFPNVTVKLLKKLRSVRPTTLHKCGPF